MQQIKEFLNFLDVLVGTFWSITLLDLYPLLMTGQLTNTALTSISGFVNLLLAIAGLIYLVLRIVHFFRMSKLNIEFKRQEIIEKKNNNFYKKWEKEFLEPKNNNYES